MCLYEWKYYLIGVPIVGWIQWVEICSIQVLGIHLGIRLGIQS